MPLPARVPMMEPGTGTGKGTKMTTMNAPASRDPMVIGLTIAAAVFALPLVGFALMQLGSAFGAPSARTFVTVAMMSAVPVVGGAAGFALGRLRGLPPVGVWRCTASGVLILSVLADLGMLAVTAVILLLFVIAGA